MGLFDKLKKKIVGGGENSTPAQPAAVEPQAAAPAPAPASIEKEDFSALSDLQMLEKIDAYTNEFKRTPNKIVFDKLNSAVEEFEARVSSIPLSQRGRISQDWSFLKAQVYNLKTSFYGPMAGRSTADVLILFADQIVSFVGKIYTELCK